MRCSEVDAACTPPCTTARAWARCWWLTPPTSEELAKDEEEARESGMSTEEAGMDKASPSRALLPSLSPPPEGVKEPLLPPTPPHDLHLAHQHVWPPAQMPVFTDEDYVYNNGLATADELASAAELSEVRRT